MSFNNYFAEYNPILQSSFDFFQLNNLDEDLYLDDFLDNDWLFIEPTEELNIPEIQIEEISPSTTKTTKTTKTSTKTSSLGQRIVDTARQYIGTPYLWGGTDPTKGLDCSAMIQLAYKQNGISIPRTSSDMAKLGRKVSWDNVKPGDIVHTPGHVRMVSKVENGKVFVIESPRSGKKVYEHELTKKDNYNIRRILSAKYGNKLIPKPRYIK